ncbi:MAG: hypothetical protein RR744_00220 [Cellulosilyticaceae bacterium]
MILNKEMFKRYVDTVREGCKDKNINLRVYYKREGFIKVKYHVITELDYGYNYDIISSMNINVGLFFWLKNKIK